jgi:hypothetical protein
VRATHRKRQASGRKQFFFEKKNQKTFAYQGQHLTCPVKPAAWRKEQKFFVSFFQKRILPLFVGASVYTWAGITSKTL